MSKLDDIKECYADHPFHEWKGFEKALLGPGERCGQTTVLVYDVGIMIEIYMAKNNCDATTAMDELNYNYFGSWDGEYTPIALHKWEDS
jgi:hypothetical protein